MHATDFVQQHSAELVHCAEARITIIEDLLRHIGGASAVAEVLPYPGALAATLRNARRDLLSVRDAAQHIVNESRSLKERAQS